MGLFLLGNSTVEGFQTPTSMHTVNRRQTLVCVGKSFFQL